MNETTRPPRVERYKGRGTQPFRFRIVGGNGETIVPSEGYATEEMREKGIRALTRAMLAEADEGLMREHGWVRVSEEGV